MIATGVKAEKDPMGERAGKRGEFEPYNPDWDYAEASCWEWWTALELYRVRRSSLLGGVRPLKRQTVREDSIVDCPSTRAILGEGDAAPRLDHPPKSTFGVEAAFPAREDSEGG